MDVITKASKIDSVLVKLMMKYKEYYIATAWASLGSKASDKLLKNKECIKKMIVGTHFYQTHPDFIDTFKRNKQVKFILKTNGIYHPKVYLFLNDVSDWECIIGSANFTYSALTKNSEVVVHIKSSDSGSENVYTTIMDTMKEYWDAAEEMSSEESHNYRKIWEKNKKKIDSLKEVYGKSKNTKPLVKSNIFSFSWAEYFKQIKDDDYNSFEERILLLSTVQKYFRETTTFSQMDELQRREISGVATKNQSDSAIDWGWFGSMGGAGRFQNKINTNNAYISKALASIPLKGKVNKSDYNKFINLFKQAFPNGGGGIGTASRLLAMKRPDYFVCLDKKNRIELCEDFGIPKTVSFEGYWDDIIERIMDSVWWLSEKPSNKLEVKAWRGRAAMLDSIFYEEKA